MSSRADGIDPSDEPDDATTVQRPAVPGPGTTVGSAPAPAPGGGVPRPVSSDVIARAPFGRDLIPDHAPIQRFDQRPRFETPPPQQATAQAAPPASSPGAPSTPQPPPPQAAHPPPPPHTPPPPPPGIDATTGPGPRRLLIPALAFGCAMLLLLGIGGGLTALWLTGPRQLPSTAASADPATAAEETEPGIWQPLEPGQVPTGTADELQQVLAENPLLEARLPVPARCSLPAAEGGAVPAAELSAYLAAGAECLGAAWGEALAPTGIDFDAPAVVVHTAEGPPSETACPAAAFTGSAPVICHDDNTLYWPVDWDPGFSHTSAEEAPQLYLWHLSYSYTVFVLASASLDGYYGALLLELADDPVRADEAQRRWALQISCLSSAAAFQMPQGVRPTDRVEEFISSVEAQGEPVIAGDPAQESRAAWVGTGRDSRGFLGVCSAWSAPVEQVR